MFDWLVKGIRAESDCRVAFIGCEVDGDGNNFNPVAIGTNNDISITAVLMTGFRLGTGFFAYEAGNTITVTSSAFVNCWAGSNSFDMPPH